MSTIIIDYEAGNLTSVARAVRYLGHECTISPDPAALRRADRIIFPGVGAAAQCMANLRRTGMDQAIREAVAQGTPVLGICVGMQLLFQRSEEDGGVACLGLIPGQVKRFRPVSPGIKVPHMGWNPVNLADPVLRAEIPTNTCFYFVHSYYCEPGPDPLLLRIAECDHGGRFCAGVRRRNLVAVQFHPEKSGRPGLRLLRNFLEARP
jgi:glutamine amidotransferase